MPHVTYLLSTPPRLLTRLGGGCQVDTLLFHLLLPQIDNGEWNSIIKSGHSRVNRHPGGGFAIVTE